MEEMANESFDDVPQMKTEESTTTNGDYMEGSQQHTDEPEDQNGNGNGGNNGEGRQLSPNADEARRDRSRSRSPFDGRNRRSGGGGGGVYRSRSRSPRRNNGNNNNNRGFKRNDMGRGGRAGGGGGGGGGVGGGQSQVDRELGLKYRWEKTIFISNIPYEVRWTELKDLFRSKITDDIVYCEIFEKDGKSMGVGSMEFKNVSDAERAVEEMNQFEINGRKIAVRLDNEGFKTRQAKEVAGDYRNMGKNNHSHHHQNHNNNNHGHNNSNQNYHTSNDSSNQAFALASTLASLSGGGNQSSNSNSLLSLLGLSNNNNGNSMGGGGGGGGNSLTTGALSSIYGGANPNQAQMNMLNQLAAQLKVDGPVTSRVFVASLDYKVDENKIREVYSLAGEVLNVSLFRDRDHRSRGMAVVEYDTPLEALNAVSMFHNQTLLDRTMTVRFDTKPQKDDDYMGGGGGGIPKANKLPPGLKSIGSGIGSLLQPSQQQQQHQHQQMNPLNTLSALSNMNSNQSPAPAAPDLTALASLAGLNTSSLSKCILTPFPLRFKRDKIGLECIGYRLVESEWIGLQA